VAEMPADIIAATAQAIREEIERTEDVDPDGLAWAALTAAAPLLAESCAPEPSGTEWGYRDGNGEIVNMGEDGQPTALSVIHAAERVGWHRTLIRRTVTYGPWEKVPDA
jgi:hypothetical protein